MSADTTSDAAAQAVTSSADAPKADWPNAAKQVRDTANLMLKTFAGLATVLIGTTPLLANVGNLHADLHGVLAIIGAVIALVGLGVIIWQAAQVNLTKVTTVEDLLNPPSGSGLAELVASWHSTQAMKTEYLGGMTLQELLDNRAAWAATRRQCENALLGVPNETDADRDVNPEPDPQLHTDPQTTTGRRDAEGPPASASPPASDRAQLAAIMQRATDTVAAADTILSNLVGWANYQRVRDAYDDAVKPILAGGVLALVGVALWLVLVTSPSASPKPPTGTSIPAGSTIGTLTWKVSRPATALRDQLKVGSRTMATTGCTKVDVLNLGGSGSTSNPWSVTTLPGSACPAIHFTVSSDLASYAPTSLATTVTADVTVHQTLTWPLVLLLALIVAGLPVGTWLVLRGRIRR